MATRKTEVNAEDRTPGGQLGDVIEELRRNYDRLTQSQKRIAEFIVEHPQAVAFSTVDQMAAQARRQSVDRGALHLSARAQRLPRSAGTNARTGARPALADRQSDRRTPGQRRASRRHQLRRLAQPRLAEPPSHHRGHRLGDIRPCHQPDRPGSTRVYVAAGFSTFPVASYFGLILDRMRPDITLLASSDAFANVRLAEIKSEDCVVAFTFPRYAASTHRIAVWSKEQGAKVIAVTDSPISAVGQIADVVAARRLVGHRHAELAGGADGGRQCAAQRRRWRRAVPLRSNATASTTS